MLKKFKKLREVLEHINALAARADLWSAKRAAIAAKEGGENARVDAIWKEYTEQATRDDANATRAKVLCLNAAYYITTEVLPEAAKIWNAYTGKRIGEKTHAKIRADLHELATAAGLNYIIIKSDNIEVKFSYKNKYYYNFDGEIDGSGSAYFTIYYYNDGDGARLAAYDEAGRAARINLDGVKKYGEYIANIDEYITRAEAARDLIITKKKELKDAQHAAAIYSDIFDPWNI